MAFFAASPFGAALPGAPPGLGPKPNSIITGTGPTALAGVVRVSWMSTVICGHLALSTWPTSVFTTVNTSPTFSPVVAISSHVTGGTSFGTRP